MVSFVFNYLSGLVSGHSKRWACEIDEVIRRFANNEVATRTVHELHASSQLPVATLIQATTVDYLGHTITDDGSSVRNFESIAPV
jgi:hypothetical protein